MPSAPIRSAPRLRRLRYEPEVGGPLPRVPPIDRVAVSPYDAGSSADGGDRCPVRRAADDECEGPAALAEAHRGVVRVLRLAFEVLDRRRPATHLAAHVDPRVLRYWRASAQQRRVRAPARFTRLRLCLPRPGVAEVAVVCDVDGRIRALAARFERTGPATATWRCTEMRLG